MNLTSINSNYCQGLNPHERTEEGKQARREWLDTEEGQQALRRAKRVYAQTTNCKLTRKKYAQSELGKLAYKRYKISKKGKETQKRYMASPKGKACQERKNEQRRAKRVTYIPDDCDYSVNACVYWFSKKDESEEMMDKYNTTQAKFLQSIHEQEMSNIDHILK